MYNNPLADRPTGFAHSPGVVRKLLFGR
jgi:hypothetical protein